MTYETIQAERNAIAQAQQRETMPTYYYYIFGAI